MGCAGEEVSPGEQEGGQGRLLDRPHPAGGEPGPLPLMNTQRGAVPTL